MGGEGDEQTSEAPRALVGGQGEDGTQGLETQDKCMSMQAAWEAEMDRDEPKTEGTGAAESTYHNPRAQVIYLTKGKC